VSRHPTTRAISPDAIPRDVRAICAELEAAGERAWVVGGCLRDVLLGRPVSDWDVATTATPERVRTLFKKVIPTGLQHGTVTVLWKGVPYEVTTLRGEGAYSDGRHPDEVFFVSDIEEDLARRDFTVNALAYDPIREELSDPFGGLADLERAVVRAVGDPVERFTEDGLRVLRAARFVATLGFTLEPATEQAIGAALHTYRKVSRERVRDEWIKTMKAEAPSRAFEVMRGTGILDATCPELAALSTLGLGEGRGGRTVDAWAHAMTALDVARADGPDMLDCHAALLQGLGRSRTRTTGDTNGDGGAEATEAHAPHERFSADMADRWLAEYRYSNDERSTITHTIRHHRIDYAPTWRDADVRRFLQRVDPARVERVIRLQRWTLRAALDLGLSELDGEPLAARVEGLAELETRTLDARGRDVPLRTRDLAIDGKRVMAHLGIPPSRRVGELLEALLNEVIEEPAHNEPVRLLELLDALAAGDRA
jgi:tRNA nucleotidyltransferase (CCA-adding enzyme)